MSGLLLHTETATMMSMWRFSQSMIGVEDDVYMLYMVKSIFISVSIKVQLNSGLISDLIFLSWSQRPHSKHLISI